MTPPNSQVHPISTEDAILKMCMVSKMSLECHGYCLP